MRKALSKKLRFEVFKRDSFKCQYCGQSAPDVILHADHIEPHSKGGSDDITNLITSCVDCNAGKGARRISDDALMQKTREQLGELQERRNQLEQMMQWKKTLNDAGNDELKFVIQAINATTPGYSVSEHGEKMVKGWLRKFTVEKLASAIEKSAECYLRTDEDGKLTMESVEMAFSKIPGVIKTTQLEREKPWIRDALYIRGILRNRFNLSNLDLANLLELLDVAVQVLSVDKLKKTAKTCHAPWLFTRDVSAALDEARNS